MSPQFTEFIISGRLGKIEPGMSRADVEAVAGTPDDVGGTSRRYSRPSIWSYGPFELHFDGNADRIERIFSDRLETAPSLSEVEALLRESDVDCEKLPWPFHDEHAVHVKASSGVEMIFTGSGPDDLRLESLWRRYIGG
jgi:hypothetical protein